MFHKKKFKFRNLIVFRIIDLVLQEYLEIRKFDCLRKINEINNLYKNFEIYLI